MEAKVDEETSDSDDEGIVQLSDCSARADRAESDDDLGSNDEAGGQMVVQGNGVSQAITEQDSPRDAEEEKVDYRESWTDMFNLSKPPYNREWRIGGPPHFWNGVEWSLLLVIKPSEGKFAAFVGYDQSSHLSFEWELPVTFRFALTAEDGTVLLEGNSSTTHTFIRPARNERYDQGQWHLFNWTEVCALLLERSALYSEQGGLFPVGIRVTMEEVFKPAIAPRGYDSFKTTGMVGLENLGATCYLNALLQMLFHVNQFRRAVYSLPFDSETLATSTTLALQNVFQDLQLSAKEVSTKELTVAFGWTTAEAFLQQDVQEMMRVLIDKLEEKMKGTVVEDATKKLFAGSVRSYIRCVHVQYESKRTEDFYDIQLDVKGCSDIYDSFRKYTTIEVLEGENQYEAEGYGKQDAQKGVTFERFPPVLTVHLKRFDFDLSTFGFTKIHDSFKFPTRLHLDEFLAADCPPESREVKNSYLLHSVLVHQGDVGGGHYYAYIRPSTGEFDYSSAEGPAPGAEGAEGAEGALGAGVEGPLEAVASPERTGKGRSKQWYKFNDEYVLQVQAREAVEQCYGRKQGELSRSMSSAYMLVYIREHDAPQIMRPVSREEIPEGLVARLNAEKAERDANSKRHERRMMFSNVWFATDEVLRDFRDYSRAQDFLSTGCMRQLEVVDNCTKMGVLLLLAAELRLSPLQVRLWEVEKKGKSPSLRVVDDYELGGLEFLCKEDKFYVEVLDHVGAAALREFGPQHGKIEAAVEELRSELRVELQSLSGQYYAEFEDPVSGVGLGQGIKRYVELKDHDAARFQHFRAQFTKLDVEMCELLKSCHDDIGRDDKLIFVKIFDPYNLLPLPGYESDESSDEEGNGNTEGGVDTEGGTSSKVESNGGTGNGGGGTVTLKRRKPEPSHRRTGEYMPAKYLGHFTINKNNTIEAIALAVRKKLAALQGAPLPLEWTQTHEHYRVFVSESPGKCQQLYPDFTNGSRINLDDDNALGDDTSSLVYIDLDPAAVNAPLLTPYALPDAPSWLKYRSYKKDLLCRPFDERDVRVLRRRHAASALSDLPGLLSASASPAHAPARKRAKPEERDRSMSIGSVGSVDRLLPDNPGTRRPRLRRRPDQLGRPFSIELPLYFHIARLVEHIGVYLNVHPDNLALFLVSLDGDCDPEPYRMVPLSIVRWGGLTLQELILRQKYFNKPNTRYGIFYQILPYQLRDEQGRNITADFKLASYLVVDERLRVWRRRYLQHLEGQAQVAEEEIAGTAAAAGVAAGVGIGEQMEVTGSAPSTPMRPAPASAPVSDSSPAPTHHNGIPIVWPNGIVSDYDPLDPQVAFTNTAANCPMHTVCNFLREAIGIPTNIGDILAASPPTHIADGAGATEPSLSEAETETDAELDLPPSELLQKLSEHSYPFSSDQLSPGPTPGPPLDPFALLVFNIRNNVADEIMGCDTVASGLVTCMPEASEFPCNLYYVGVQHVDYSDLMFMANAHPTIHSVPITVYSFTLLGSGVKSCDPHLFGGPFFSYVRQDDDYFSLARRLGRVTGDADWDRYRLAVVELHTQPSVSVPHFITRPVPAQTPSQSKVSYESKDEEMGPMPAEGGLSINTALGAGAGVGAGAGTPRGPTVWQLLRQKGFGGSKSRDGSPGYARIAIQRSVSDIAGSKRSKRLATNSIKII